MSGPGIPSAPTSRERAKQPSRRLIEPAVWFFAHFRSRVGNRPAGGVNRATRQPSDEHGIASIQTVILYPVVLLLVFAMVQGVIYFHAQNLARSVANGAVQAARVEDGTEDAGRAEANRRLDQGRDVLLDVTVTVERGQETVTATVSGLAPSLVAGLEGLSIKQTATGPVERFTPAVQP